MQNKIVGGFLGLACGDALGAPAEFQDKEYIRLEWGILREMTGGGGWNPGEWTDDTAMALCVAEGILANPDDPAKEVARRFLAWYRRKPKDVGITVGTVLSSYKGDWVKASSGSLQAKSGKAAGNGSLMRTLPIALAFPDVDRMLRVSARVSALTHWDSQAEMCCAIYCLWIWNLLNGEELRDGWLNALSTAKSLKVEDFESTDTPGIRVFTPEWWNRLENVEEKTIDQIQPTGYAGYVVDCLEAAVWCCLKSNSLENTLIRAVNLGGETDTIGAVAGGAAGVHYGLESIPERWLNPLLKRKELEDVGIRLSKLHSHNGVYAPERKIRKLEHNKVADRIYVGRNPLTSVDVEKLQNEGITHILDMREEKEWNSPDKFGMEAITAISELGIIRAHLPVADVHPPSDATFTKAEELLNDWLSNPNNIVYIHCRAGQERSGSIVTAYYAKKNGLTYDQALVKLQAERDKIRPTFDQAAAARKWLGKDGS